MSVRSFLDTNVIVYAFAVNGSRALTAERLLIDGGVISVQVLNEFVNVSRRKLKLEWPTVHRNVAIVRKLVGQLLPPDRRDARRRARHRGLIQNPDSTTALLIASACEGKCETLLTEDLQHGVRIEGVAIRNPFI
ncbi:MAG: PIN domain-containing protein [Alphaproteobacteria bacterium]